MALSGELKDFGLLQLLTLVQVTGKTGALTLQRTGETATVYFDSGQLVKVRANGSHSTDLATALHRAGKIGRDQYESITLQAPSEKSLGLLLEDQGLLSRDELATFVADRSVAELFSLLTWAEGSFRMDVDVSPPEDDIHTPVDLTPILEKGRTYLDEWNLLSSTISDLERPLRLMAEPQQHSDEISLTLDEWRLVSSLAANVPLREVAQRLGLDEFAVRQVAYGLISTGLAEVAEPELAPLPRFQEPIEPEQSKGGLSRLFGQRKK